MDIHEATRIITSTLQSQRRTPAWKDGYVDGLLNSGYCGGYGETKRKMYTQGFEVGVADREAVMNRTKQTK